MLVPMQVVMGPIELVLEPGLMPQLKLEPQPELVLVLKLRLEPEPMPQPELVLMPGQLLELVLIHRLEPELTPTIQLAVLKLEPQLVLELELELELKLERQREFMDQQPMQLLKEFLIVKPELLLVHLELQPIMTLHHHKAFDWSTRVVLGSIPGCIAGHRDKRFH